MFKNCTKFSNLLNILGIIIATLYFIYKDDTLVPEAHFDIFQTAQHYGFVATKYRVKTEDGYYLSLFRLTHSQLHHINDNDVQANKTKAPLLMIHGNMETPLSYMKNGNKSLAFILANQGYDIWLGASRGSRLSMEHEYLDPDTEKQYWDFDWQEMGKYDVPAFIETIVSETGHQQVGYFGYSQGTTQLYFAMSGGCNQDPKLIEYFQKRIKIFVSLATTVKLYHHYSPFVTLGSVLYPILEWTTEYLEMHSLRPDHQTSSVFCYKFPFLCEYTREYLMIDAKVGINDYYATRIQAFRNPSYASMRCQLHPLQLSRVDRYQCYDYGEQKNMQVYGTAEPSEIQLSNIKNIPIALIHGSYDRLVGKEDYEWLRQQVNQNIVFSNEYELGHSGFHMAQNITFIDDILQVLDQYAVIE